MESVINRILFYLLPIFTLLISPWSNFNLTLWPTYTLLINSLLRHSTHFPFIICSHLVEFVLSNAFCKSMKHSYNSSCMFKVRCGIILSIPIASLDPVPLLNPKWSPNKATVFITVSNYFSPFALVFKGKNENLKSHYKWSAVGDRIFKR